MKIKKQTFLYAVAAIVGITTVVYLNSLWGDFICDDWPGIVNNKKIRSIEYLPGYFTKGLLDNTELGIKDTFLYRPLIILYGFLNYQAWGANPLGFHLSSLLLHIGNSVLVFFLLKRLLNNDLLAPLLGSFIFAVHPVHVESVSWVANPDSMVTFFLLLSIQLYLRYKEINKIALILLSVLFFVFALLSKEVAVVFPLILFLYDYIYEKRIYIVRLAAFTVMTLLYFYIRTLVLGKSLGQLNPSLNGFMHLLEFGAGYIKLLFIPWPSVFYFYIPPQGILTVWSKLFSAFALIALTIYACKNRLVLFSLLWIFITLLPPLSLAFFSRPTFAERFLYLPSVGFVIIISIFISMMCKKYRKVALFITLLVILSFGFITLQANRDWKNDESFYSMVIRSNPYSYNGYQSLATYYEKKGQIEKAIAVSTSSLSYIDENRKGQAYENIAFWYGKKGDADKSIFFYRKMLEVSPKKTTAFMGIGNNYFIKEDYNSALQYYKEAFALDNENYEACYNLALTYEAMGDSKSALQYYDLFLKNANEDRYSDTLKMVRERLKNRGGRQ